MTHILPATLLAAVAIAALPSVSSAQEFQKPDPDKWYRLETRYNGSDIRKGRCIEYFPEGSEHPDLLWSADPLDASNPDSDYQYWRFEPSPDNPDHYAMICKAAPDGYVNPIPTAYDNSGRWKYVTAPSADTAPDYKYGFIFVTEPTLSGVDPDTGASFCAIATITTVGKEHEYMNCGSERQDYAINLRYEINSEEANEWLFNFVERYDPTTGIAEISESDTTDPDAPIYDLMGRRVTNPSHGIYIINGKKVAM